MVALGELLCAPLGAQQRPERLRSTAAGLAQDLDHPSRRNSTASIFQSAHQTTESDDQAQSEPPQSLEERLRALLLPAFTYEARAACPPTCDAAAPLRTAASAAVGDSVPRWLSDPAQELLQTLPASGGLWLPSSSRARKFFVLAVNSPLFSFLTLAVVVANCVVLAVTVPSPTFDQTPFGQRCAQAECAHRLALSRRFLAPRGCRELRATRRTGPAVGAVRRREAFTIIFVVEAWMKIMAMGFVLQPGSYLRDYWNMCATPASRAQQPACRPRGRPNLRAAAHRRFAAWTSW